MKRKVDPGYFGKEEDPREISAYGLTEVARYVGVPYGTLQYWVGGKKASDERAAPPPIQPAEAHPLTLSFWNLVEAHVLASLRRKHRFSLPAVRQAIGYLQEHYPSKHPLADQSFETDGKDLFVEVYGKTINLSKKGQLAMREVLDRYLHRIERDTAGLASRLFPFARTGQLDGPRVVVIDPLVSFGRPVLFGTGVRTDVVAGRFKAGEDLTALAEDFGRPPADIQEAIRWELRREAA